MGKVALVRLRGVPAVCHPGRPGRTRGLRAGRLQHALQRSATAVQSAAPARTRCQRQPVPRSAMPCAFKQKGERVHVHMTGRALPAALRGRLLLERHLQDTQGAAAEPQAARGLLRWPRRVRRALPPEGPDAPRDCRAAVGRRLHRTRRHRAARTAHAARMPQAARARAPPKPPKAGRPL